MKKIESNESGGELSGVEQEKLEQVLSHLPPELREQILENSIIFVEHIEKEEK